MDLKPFKLDIDELINDFNECGSNTFAEFKRLWLSRKFSFIFEARPSSNQGFFMQSLYAHSIGHMVSTGSLSNRLGGLYCLYCLFETQPFKPCFKIYLSLGELRKLKNLVMEAKAIDLKVVSALVKSMLTKNMFLFGYMGANEGSVTERVNELTDIQNAHVQTAYQKLFANTRLEHFIHMDLARELDVDLLKKKSSEYAVAKELAIKEASQVLDVENIKHIAENKISIGDVVEKTVADWNIQKEMFYDQTGIHSAAAEPPNQENNELYLPQSLDDNTSQREPWDIIEAQGDENVAETDAHDDFSQQLEEVLLFQPLESDDEDVDQTEN
ncbi:hypothetical protein F511_21123 [Dorcoceras hygrometricum]|uniref:Small nuclear RNA activating complex (SNAPc), subunit SNAP43 protein n=1 Tax=Dorcoceras hygrometricum TaxID=472368 RepID=A0A2Z7CU03_9LAMI|nr:hypothetical protein F511_21123 [Dorcoceras hygrometricum]